ncbi:hypothetical protein E4K67_28875 [Desulfosporosinus fructosivorans]|uniref:Uncharacterized protein n=1 Tax=Desulfosporosinus fructosivorans TaxID=2018669 RepID=A0A4Z0QVE6_9FIRM|nr:hypothetical protein E4K67_28875 [Desulfosporosinus fructosivorans]
MCGLRTRRGTGKLVPAEIRSKEHIPEVRILQAGKSRRTRKDSDMLRTTLMECAKVAGQLKNTIGEEVSQTARQTSKWIYILRFRLLRR